MSAGDGLRAIQQGTPTRCSQPPHSLVSVIQFEEVLGFIYSKPRVCRRPRRPFSLSSELFRYEADRVKWEEEKQQLQVTCHRNLNGLCV
jgi:hypothetical protein